MKKYSDLKSWIAWKRADSLEPEDVLLLQEIQDLIAEVGSHRGIAQHQRERITQLSDQIGRAACERREILKTCGEVYNQLISMHPNDDKGFAQVSGRLDDLTIGWLCWSCERNNPDRDPITSLTWAECPACRAPRP